MVRKFMVLVSSGTTSIPPATCYYAWLWLKLLLQFEKPRMERMWLFSSFKNKQLSPINPCAKKERNDLQWVDVCSLDYMDVLLFFALNIFGCVFSTEYLHKGRRDKMAIKRRSRRGWEKSVGEDAAALYQQHEICIFQKYSRDANQSQEYTL